MKNMLLTGVFATVLSGAALAGDGMKAATFESLDTDGDGEISSAEAALHQGLKGAYKTADSNADGQVVRSEFDAWTSATKRDMSKPSMTSTSERTSTTERSSTTVSPSNSDRSNPKQTPTIAPTP